MGMGETAGGDRPPRGIRRGYREAIERLWGNRPQRGIRRGNREAIERLL